MSERLPDPDPHLWPSDPQRWTLELPTGTPLSRLFPGGGPHPTRWNTFRSWGPTNSRFDHHPDPVGDHPTMGVMYLGRAGIIRHGRAYPAFTCALGEYYQDRKTVDPEGALDHHAVFTLARPVRVLDIGDTDWVTVAGGNAAICSGERSQARKWAREIYLRYPTIEGIAYSSSVNPAARAVALWERAATSLPPAPALSAPLRSMMNAVERAAATIGYGVIL